MLYPGSERPPPPPGPLAGRIGLLHRPEEDLDLVNRLCGRGAKLCPLLLRQIIESGHCRPTHLPCVVKPRTDLPQPGQLDLVAAGDLHEVGVLAAGHQLDLPILASMEEGVGVGGGVCLSGEKLQRREGGDDCGGHEEREEMAADE